MAGAHRMFDDATSEACTLPATAVDPEAVNVEDAKKTTVVEVTPTIAAPKAVGSTLVRPYFHPKSSNRSRYKLPQIRYLETNENWLNVRWLLKTIRWDIMNSSYYLNRLDINRRFYRGTASILKHRIVSASNDTKSPATFKTHVVPIPLISPILRYFPQHD